MSRSTTNRRRFLVAAITFSGLAGSLTRSSFLPLSSAWAQSGNEIDPDTRAAMVRMARLLFPHDALTDDVYADVLDQALVSTAGDSAFASTLDAAEDALNAQQAEDFLDLKEAAQIKSMTAVQDMDFFATIRAAVGSALYYHPALWAHIGYEGPSFDKGGYLYRGSGDIDWLPEGE